MSFEEVSLGHPHDFFKYKSISPKPGSCFVLMPFAAEYNLVYATIVEALEGLMVCTRADDLRSSGPILERILRGIASSELIIADLTGQNPNVFYELGLAHVQSKNVLLLTQDLSHVPFDLKHYFCHEYKTEPKAALNVLKDEIRQFALEISASRVPKTLENASIRTQRIVDYMKWILKSPQNCNGMVIRIQASLSSLGNLGRPTSELDPDARKYAHLLENEREYLIQLIEAGAILRSILSPHRVSTDPGESRDERNQRIDRVIQFLDREDDVIERCELVVSPTPGPNLLFFGGDILFEGHKTQIERGFGWTMAFTDSELIEARMNIFDRLFESASDYTLQNFSSEDGHSGSRVLRQAVKTGLEDAKISPGPTQWI